MRIEEQERLVLFLQMQKDAHHDDMLQDIGMIASMIGMPVVHGIRRACRNARSVVINMFHSCSARGDLAYDIEQHIDRH